MLNAIFGRSEAAAMSPDAVRTLRDELGWTQEQLADAACVSLLEVSAWEAGVVPVPAAQAAVLARAAWQERRERAWAEAGVRPCAWAAQILASFEDLQYDEYEGVEQLRRASHRLRTHQKRCAVCRRAAEVERRLPPPPVKLLARGSSAPMASRFLVFSPDDRPRTPSEVLRLIVVTGLLTVVLALFLALIDFISDPSAGFRLSGEMPVLCLSLFAGVVVADTFWDDLHRVRPYLGGFLKAATVALSVAAVAMWRLDGFFSDGVIASLAVVAAVVYGNYLGQTEAKAQASEEDDPVAHEGASAPPSLPGQSVEPDVEPEPRREAVEAGRYEH